MALEDLNPAVRVEEILDGADIEPATRLEYFMKKAANEVPKPAGSTDAGKVVTVNEDGDGFELVEPPSGLPEYTSADKGKVLTIVEGESGETTVIVPKWEAAGGGIFKVLADYSTGALDKNFREIDAAITGGLLPVVFTQGASFPVILATLTNSVYTVFALSASPSSTQVTLTKWGAALPTAPLTPLA
jgi:hypothetical protein